MPHEGLGKGVWANLSWLLMLSVRPQDALLHAIKEEYVEAVETLLLWEEENHVPGEPYVSTRHDQH